MSIARVHVELKPSKKGPDIDFKIMHAEFKNRVSDVGILAELRDRQNFQSKSQKKRIALRQAIQKRKEDEIEGQILRGEKVDGSSKIVRKIRNRINSKKAKDRRNYRGGGDKNRSY